MNNNFPKVSIILLNYNGFEDTIECFNSLQNISYLNHNIIIVDNDSPDKSMDKINEYMINNHLDFIYYKDIKSSQNNVENKYITLIQSGSNGGYGHGNNVGIKYALKNNSDYIMILNNDTIVEKNFLEPLIEECSENSSIGIISSQIFYENKPNIFWENGGSFNLLTGKVRHTNFNELNTGQINNENCTFLSGCLWLIPKKVFIDIGFINEDYFMYVEDLEFCQRALISGYKLRVSSKSRIYHKVSNSSGGGEFTKLSAYYLAKNKFKFIFSDFFKGNKTIATLFILIEPIRLIKTKQNKTIIISYLKGLIDFFLNKDVIK